jgi:solute carrier family 29 (equilibrative nucleoside transporter) protein 4
MSDSELLVDSPESGLQSQTSPNFDKSSDRWNLVYISFVVAGTGFLFPYNSFITAVDYFENVYPNSRYEFFVSLVYFYTTLFAVFVNNMVVQQIGLHMRIRLSYVLFCFPLVAVMVLSAVIGNKGSDGTFAITLVGVAVVSVAGGVQQASYYGFTGMLPRKYTQAVMTGESAAGLAVSIDRIVTKAAFESCKTSALVFFGISLVFNVFCALLFEFVQRTSFVRHHVALCHQPLKEEKYENSIELLALNAPSGSPTRQIVSCKRRQIFTKLRNGWHTRMLVSKRLWRLMVTIGLVYFVTLLLFPGLLSEVRGDSFHDDWLPVVLIAAFNLFDFIGKV